MILKFIKFQLIICDKQNTNKVLQLHFKNYFKKYFYNVKSIDM